MAVYERMLSKSNNIVLRIEKENIKFSTLSRMSPPTFPGTPHHKCGVWKIITPSILRIHLADADKMKPPNLSLATVCFDQRCPYVVVVRTKETRTCLSDPSSNDGFIPGLSHASLHDERYICTSATLDEVLEV